MGRWILGLAALMARISPPFVIQALYRLGPASRGLRALLNLSAASGEQEVIVAAGLLRGTRLKLDLQREKTLWLGTYEPELQTTLREVLRPGMVFYDVGANLGYISLGAAREVASAGEVHAFEPLPHNIQRLLDAVERNNLGDTVRVVAAAVGPQSGPGKLLVHPSGAMGKLEGSPGRDLEYVQSETVEVLALDDYVYGMGQRPPHWIKIDVEGGEAMVLEGMTRVLHSARPGVLLEIHGPEAAEKVFRRLTAAGYAISTLGAPRTQLESARQLTWKAYLRAEPGES